MSEPVISFSGLGHAYKAGQWIFRYCDGTLEKSRVVSLLGPNGSGKTTLLRIVMGMLAPTEGMVSTNGRIAFVPQLFQVSFDYSVLDLVLMGRARQVGLFSQPSRHDRQAAMTMLERFKLADFAGRPFKELSGGQRQLVIFARALVGKPDVLVMDEPTSALDFSNQAMLLDWIGRLSRDDGLTILFTTHQPNHALAIADDAMLMGAGGHFEMGPSATVLTEDSISGLFGVRTKMFGYVEDGQPMTCLVPLLSRPGSITNKNIKKITQHIDINKIICDIKTPNGGA